MIIRLVDGPGSNGTGSGGVDRHGPERGVGTKQEEGSNRRRMEESSTVGEPRRVGNGYPESGDKTIIINRFRPEAVVPPRPTEHTS